MRDDIGRLHLLPGLHDLFEQICIFAFLCFETGEGQQSSCFQVRIAVMCGPECPCGLLHPSGLEQTDTGQIKPHRSRLGIC